MNVINQKMKDVRTAFNNEGNLYHIASRKIIETRQPRACFMFMTRK